MVLVPFRVETCKKPETRKSLPSAPCIEKENTHTKWYLRGGSTKAYLLFYSIVLFAITVEGGPRK
jgi:hypothetical protein